MKQFQSTIFWGVYMFSFLSCKNDNVLAENKRLMADNNRLVKDIAMTKWRYDSLQTQFNNLQAQFVSYKSMNDSLQNQIIEEKRRENIRKKAESTPLELPSITVQNENEKGGVLKVKGPFKKVEARYISFKGVGINNSSKVGKKLSGRILGVYKLGTLVQQMKNSSGTFVGNDGLNRIYTHSWTIISDKEIIPLDKGIGDRSKGIFQAGHWTLELWFEPKGANRAYRLSEAKFDIQ